MSRCIKCKSVRLVSISGKTSDLCHVEYKSAVSDGYVPYKIGIGGGDYIRFTYCLDCGKIQYNFPIKEPEFFVRRKND